MVSDIVVIFVYFMTAKTYSFYVIFNFYLGLITSIVQRLDTILRNQEFIKVTQREQTSLIDLLLKKTSTTEPELKDVEKEFGFPLETLESIKNLENDLLNEVFRAKLVSVLSKL